MLKKLDNSRGAKHKVFWMVDPRWMILAVPISLPFFAGIWFFFGSSIDNWLHQRKFSTVLWKADIWDSKNRRYVYGGDWAPRLCMVEGLMASGRLLGMTKSQVVDLLGPPDQKTDFIGNRQRFIEATFTYHMGPERGFIRIDSEALVLEFDVDDKVGRQYIYRD
jgi:hypothetical protein